jgi:signal transduction histidine kinase
MYKILKDIRIYLLLLFISIIGYFGFYKWVINTEVPEKIFQSIQQKYLENESILKNNSIKLHNYVSRINTFSWRKIDSLTKYDNNLVFIFKEKKLVYWNSNEILLTKQSVFLKNNSGVYHFPVGWYQYFSISDSLFQTILFKNISEEYPVNNRYLINSINKEYSRYNNLFFTASKQLSDFKIVNGNGKFVLGIKLDKTKGLSEHDKNVLSLILIIIFIILILMISKVCFLNPLGLKNKYVQALILFANYFFLFAVFAVFLVPDYLKSSFMFEHWKTIVPIVNTRGTAILFSVYIFIFSYYFSKIIYWRKEVIKQKPIVVLAFLSFFLTLTLFFILNKFYVLTLKHNDVAIGFLFRHDFVELFFISFIIISVFLLQDSILSHINFKRETIIFIIIQLLLTSVLLILFKTLPFNIIVSVLIIQLFLPLINFYAPTEHNITFIRYLLILIIFSASVSILINSSFRKYIDNKQKETAQKLLLAGDESIREKFLKIKEQINKDNYVENMIIDTINDKELIDYIYYNYLKNNFSTYDVQITLCRNNYLLQIQPEGEIIPCHTYFDQIKKENKIVESDSSLVFINNQGESIYYLGEINLKKDSINNDIIYIEFYSSIIPNELGYPEVLKNENNGIDVSGYSIAKYVDDKLVYSYGDYDYHTKLTFLDSYPNENFFYTNDFIHYKLHVNKDEVLIISRPRTTFAGKLATFSMLFILFTILGIVLYIAYYGRKTKYFLRYSFRARLQLFLTVTLLTLFILLSGITVYYFFNTRQTVIVNQLREKTKSVLTELQNHFVNDHNIFSDSIYAEEMLKELSVVFFTDINIYDNNGMLSFTSRNKIFEKGILSKLINPESYEKIMIDNKLFYITIEKIGKLEFYSAYVPLTMNETKLSGILNLPYFARQSKINESFFSILFNYINLFVLVAILGTLIAIIISRLITKPLSLLQKSLSETRLDKKNEPIEWKHDDEIGKLIEEYNKMVVKLEESAKLLKRSERETAWREIAQQIAHEIRNPLTPIKLNIQYLQKSFKENDPEFKQKLDSITQSIISQIESLNEVASMFSDLSRLNTKQKVELDIIPLIKSSISLYKNYDNIDFKIKSDIKEAYVYARESELLRVFNNLIKNSVQSISAEGIVDVNIEETNDYFVVKIKDTGKGMSDEVKQKIFSPYFTTKSGGTGIGLAIVKNIISEMGGNIEFVSEEGKGTTFLLRLPKIKTNKH